MPIGPKGEKRPHNPNAAAIMVGRIVTGRAQEEYVDAADLVDDVKKPASESEKAHDLSERTVMRGIKTEADDD